MTTRPPPPRRPSVTKSLDQHEQRMRVLERTFPLAPYAYLSSNVHSYAIPAGPTEDIYFYDLDPDAENGTNFFTNAPEIFDTETITLAADTGRVNSGDFVSLGILHPGLYLLFKTLEAPLAADNANVSLYQQTGNNLATSVMLFGWGENGPLIQHHISHFELLDVDGPTGPIVLGSENGESSIVTVYVQMLAVRVDNVDVTTYQVAGGDLAVFG